MHGQANISNEMYLLIKYIKSVLWIVAKRLSLYTGRAVPKVWERAFKQFKSPVLNVLIYLLFSVTYRALVV